MRQEATNYVDGEGRNFMQGCISRSIEWCERAGLNKVVIFTGNGDGAHYAAKEILSREKYNHIMIIAVTPPVGREYRTNPADPASPMVRAGISPAMLDELSALGVSVVAAHLPFKGIQIGRERSSEWTRVAEAYGVLGGGFALCIQAVLVACDAGAVQSGERVVVASADTAFTAIASRTESFLSPKEGLLVEHIICRPLRYQISKPTHSMVEQMWAPIILPELPTQNVATEPNPAPASLEASPEIAATPTAPATTSAVPTAANAATSEQRKPTKHAKKRASS